MICQDRLGTNKGKLNEAPVLKHSYARVSSFLLAIAIGESVSPSSSEPVLANQAHIPSAAGAGGGGAAGGAAGGTADGSGATTAAASFALVRTFLVECGSLSSPIRGCALTTVGRCASETAMFLSLNCLIENDDLPRQDSETYQRSWSDFNV